MDLAYFRKELVGQPLYLPNGIRAPFEDIGAEEGVLATDNGWLALELRKAAARRVGGVVEIDKATFEALKKNAPSKPPSRFFSNNDARSYKVDSGRQAAREARPTASKPAGPAAVGARPATAKPEPQRGAPLEVPEIHLPLTRRRVQATQPVPKLFGEEPEAAVKP